MSYDISIMPKVPDAALPKAEVTSYLMELGLTPDGPSHFTFLESGTPCADADLEWREGEGCGRRASEVNLIQVHIPAVYVQSKLANVVGLCRQIGKRLGWVVYDEQEETYL